MIRNTVHALAQLAVAAPAAAPAAPIAFVTHSIPHVMNDTSGPDGGAYVAQHHETARLVAEGVAKATGRERQWDLVYCSRSGPPSQRWLEPDIVDHLTALRARGARAAVLVPIGFVSDHMEVKHDLDLEAADHAGRIGLTAVRAATVGADPQFVAMVRELVLERVGDSAAEGKEPAEGRRALGALGPSHDVCPLGCCPNPRGPRPAAGRE
jgi:protoporphyrin/coproporphyrin ferrochelatase